MPDPPATLPADFFDKNPPNQLPADFFDKQPGQPGIKRPRVPGLTEPPKQNTFMTGKFGPDPAHNPESPWYQPPADTGFAAAHPTLTKVAMSVDPLALGVSAEHGVVAGAAGYARRALSIGASLAGGFVAREGAKKLGVGELGSDAIGLAAAVWAGGKISPEIGAKVKEIYELKGLGGVKILLGKLGIKLEQSKDDLAEGIYREDNGLPPDAILTNKQRQQARIDAQKEVRKQLGIGQPKEVKPSLAKSPSQLGKNRGEPPAPPPPPTPAKGSPSQLGKNQGEVPKPSLPTFRGSTSQRMPSTGGTYSGTSGSVTNLSEAEEEAEEVPKGKPPLKPKSTPVQTGAEEPTGAAGPQATPAKGDAATYVHDPKVDIGKTSRQLNLGAVASAQANVKNQTMAARFLGKTRQEILGMDEAEYKTHLKIVNAERRAKGLSQFEPPRPGVNRRTFKELLADIADDADELRGKTPAPKPEKAPEPPKKDFEF